jgi:hypothetical protein
MNVGIGTMAAPYWEIFVSNFGIASLQFICTTFLRLFVLSIGFFIFACRPVWGKREEKATPYTRRLSTDSTGTCSTADVLHNVAAHNVNVTVRERYKT